MPQITRIENRAPTAAVLSPGEREVALHAGLARWIQPQHLTEEAVASYRKILQAHPARLLLLKDFLQPSVAQGLAEFLTTEAEFRTTYGLYSADDQCPTEAAWVRADECDRFFKFSKLASVSKKCRFSSNMLGYLRFRSAFDDACMRAYFERLAGLRLGYSASFGCHSMKAGDFLKPHDDNDRKRRLALIFYLTPGWEPSFGGALILKSAQGNQTSIEAEYNSAVVFDVTTGSKHFIEAIRPDAGSKARLTISGWYLNGV